MKKQIPTMTKGGVRLWKQYYAAFTGELGDTFNHELDCVLFARWCDWYALFLRSIADIEKNGAAQVTNSGYEQVRPSMGLAQKSSDHMLKLENAMGLSSAARARIGIDTSKPEVDPFD